MNLDEVQTHYENHLIVLTQKLAEAKSQVTAANERLTQAQELKKSLKKTIERQNRWHQQELQDREILAKQIQEQENPKRKSGWFGGLKRLFN